MKVKKISNNPGVYVIRNLKNGKVYVGSTMVGLLSRWKSHRKAFRRRGNSKHLQAAWDKYGEQAFIFEVLEELPNSELKQVLIREQYWLDKLQASNPEIGYNLSPTAGSPFGYKRSDETKKKHSDAYWSKTPEERAAIIEKRAAANRGKKRSEATRKKMSNSMKGRKPAESTRKAVSESNKRRDRSKANRKLSETYWSKSSEERAAIQAKRSVALRKAWEGREKIISDETKLNMSLSHKGKPWSQARREAQLERSLVKSKTESP